VRRGGLLARDDDAADDQQEERDGNEDCERHGRLITAARRRSWPQEMMYILMCINDGSSL
jgi:hypothetical protein